MPEKLFHSHKNFLVPNYQKSTLKWQPSSDQYLKFNSKPNLFILSILFLETCLQTGKKEINFSCVHCEILCTRAPSVVFFFFENWMVFCNKVQIFISEPGGDFFAKCAGSYFFRVCVTQARARVTQGQK